MGVIEDLADALARDVLEAQAELGDDRFYEKMSKVLGELSPTTQEAFMTSVRVRLAEKRGRDFLARMLAAKRSGGAAPQAPRGPDSGH
ncbi:hypothetical protein GU927_011030 [Rhodobacteraceae bacterium HSP-20]|uniref:Uncharacterized protein n=1 Tax=Paragemmobacter amnigenus TaxID=2852097 RepID=A0ABS6J3N8_9RHOB|nr:hypothetical protein [Rhodobacter amnigenus]MBU9698378.1 hypothetical protein [Rhodobacter amnigenus]MBV4389605.1 hypothetical protein [Rhodobacter amnigenus]